MLKQIHIKNIDKPSYTLRQSRISEIPCNNQRRLDPNASLEKKGFAEVMKPWHILALTEFALYPARWRLAWGVMLRILSHGPD